MPSNLNNSKTPILFGLETEIGIARDGMEELDVVAESIALVRCAKDHGISMKWDYRAEDPHRDARGFRVRELRQDHDELGYQAQDARRLLTREEIKSDLVLANGARFYNDHAHPEYCTPECSDLMDLSYQDRAGDCILMECARMLSLSVGRPIHLYKNNTDFSGHSYGCHENYLIPRSLPWNKLTQSIQAFLATRQIFTGAGKFAMETEDRWLGHGFQISQRADFFTELQSVDTMQKRPIINTRDEPHANPEKYRRFHVILGDANMSPFATRLKVGTTALVLEAIVQDPERSGPILTRPLEALQAISRDSQFQWPVEVSGRGPSTAIQVQRDYLEWVRAACDFSSPWKQTLCEEWDQVLTDLEVCPERCRNRLDWVAKYHLIREFADSQSVDLQDPWLMSLDLEYHRLDLEEGLFFQLEQQGSMRMTLDPAKVRDAVNAPPPDTRAAIRGLCVQRFAPLIQNVQWDHLLLAQENRWAKISLLDLFQESDILRYRQALLQATCLNDLIQANIATPVANNPY